MPVSPPRVGLWKVEAFGRAPSREVEMKQQSLSFFLPVSLL